MPTGIAAPSVMGLVFDQVNLVTKTAELGMAAVDRATTGSISQLPKKLDAAARPAAQSRSSSREAVFTSVAFPLKRLAAAKKLEPSLASMNARALGDCARRKCSPAERDIAASVVRASDASIRDKLRIINTAVNRAVEYKRDIDLYGVADKWATPDETMRRAAGDCEDYAILKMAALRSAGIPKEDMSLVIIFDQRRKVYHAVLSVTVGDSYYILDNLRDAVVTDKRLPDYMPLFSLANGRNYFHGSRVGQGKAVASLGTFDKIAPGEGPEL